MKRIADRDLRPISQLTALVDAAVRGAAPEPEQEMSCRLNLPEVPVQVQKNVLRDLLSQCRFLKKMVSNTEDEALVFQNQF
jgi:hypothetical protein